MIKEDYCSEELFNLLRDNGFNGKYQVPNSHSNKLLITHQAAMKWLREVKHIYIQIRFSGLVVPVTKYVVDILNSDENWIDNDIEEKTYEGVVETALKFCLTNLIKNK